MDNTAIMKKNIRKGTFIFFLYTLLAIGLSTFVVALIPLEKNLANSLYILACVLIFALIYRKDLPAGWPLSSGEECPIGVFLICLGFFALYQIINSFLSGTEEQSGIKLVEYTWQYLVYMGICVPVCEDLIFRGLVMEHFRPFGNKFAIIASSVLFGMYHCNPIQLVSASILGLILGYIALKYSVKYSIFLHIINNGFFVIVYGMLGESYGTRFTLYGLALKIILVVAGIIAFIRLKPIRTVKEYLAENTTVKGSYRALFGNVWFVLTIVIFVAISALAVIGIMTMAKSMPQQ